MSDIGETVSRLKGVLDRLMRIQGLPEGDMKEAVIKLLGGEHRESKKVFMEFQERQLKSLSPEEEKEARKLLEKLGLGLTVQQKLLAELDEKSPETMEKLDEEFIHFGRYSIHEYSDPDDKEIVLAFMKIFNEHRDVCNIYDASYSIDNLSAGTIASDSRTLWRQSLKRWLKLSPAFVFTGSRIRSSTRRLYEESRKCFVFENYLAAIAMCRAVLENMLKIKFNLIERNWTTGEVLQKLYEKKQIPQEVYNLSKKLKDKADPIPHKGANATEKEALSAINITRDLIEMYYGMPTQCKGNISPN